MEYPEIIEDFKNRIGEDWVEKVLKGKNIVLRGKEAYEQINILGDDGVPLEYHKRYWKSELIDFVILQQDAFDKVDANCPMERQSYMYYLVLDICEREFDFDNFEECGNFYKKIINTLRQMNYSKFRSEDFNKYLEQLNNELNDGK